MGRVTSPRNRYRHIPSAGRGPLPAFDVSLGTVSPTEEPVDAMSSTNDQSISPLELWKAQLAYVSGTILAWGAVLLQFWPALAQLQTGAHVHAIGRDEGVTIPPTSYYLLALLVAVGLGMLIFGAAHIVARGFWLARLSMHGPSSTSSPASERVSRSAYVILHVFWVTSVAFLCVVPLFALSALLATQFAALRWPLAIARVLASVLAFAPPLAAGVVWYRRRAKAGPRALRSMARWIGYRNVAIAYVALPLLWLLVLEFSYVAELRLEHHLFSRSQDPNVVVSIQLSGAVSDPSPVQVSLVGTAPGPRAPQPLLLREVNDGLHMAILPTRSLPNGDYQITMTYPHTAISPNFPFFTKGIQRRVRFVVVD